MKYALVGGVGLLIVFLLFVYNRYKVTREKNKIIEFQKELVDQKQKAIIDSIEYAKRIQRSHLPTETYIDNSLKRLMKSK